jgi:hypothetical protein
MRSQALKSLKASAGKERVNSEVQAGHTVKKVCHFPVPRTGKSLTFFYSALRVGEGCRESTLLLLADRTKNSCHLALRVD